jgi:alpha-D-xyloside xylohydrolase
MAATLRSGLSFGLCGFTYWSHDAGGFVGRAPRELYRRWLPFAALSSHTRCHGAPPREPWEYDESFTDDFRRTIDLRYRLLPYIYAQARHSSDHGYPLLRALFFEFPEDPASWLVEDQYMFGSDLLVAPLFAESESRSVYLPPGRWIDYQTGQSFDGRRWRELSAGRVPIVLLARSGSVIPHANLAQSTQEVDWSELALRVFTTDGSPAIGRVALPDGGVHEVKVSRDADGAYQLQNDPFDGDVEWRITQAAGE